MNRRAYFVGWHGLVGLLILYTAFQYLFVNSGAGDDYPQKPIQVVVPFNPGGASDTFARIFQKAVNDYDLMPQPLVIVNKAGGSSTIGINYVRDARDDGYTVLCLHEAIMTAKLTGQSRYGPESFEAVAATGEFSLMILVPNESPYYTLSEFMADAKKRPNEIILGSNLNTPTYFAYLNLEATVPGTKFRFVSAGGGANRLASLIGGHMDAAFFSVSEYISFKDNGLRPLALFDDRRDPSIPEVPTANELGFPVTSTNLHYWWFPKGTDPEIVRYFSKVLDKAMQTDYVRTRMDEFKILPRVIVGEELQEKIDQRMEYFSKFDPPRMLELPNVVAWTIGALLVFGAGIIRSCLTTPVVKSESIESIPKRFDLAWKTIALVVVYVAVMALDFISFVWATILFVLICATMLNGLQKTKVVYLLEITFLMSFGLHYVFTEIFTVSLP
ncbi:MAG: tripartite tricarboxylate transporter substrate-binding protein [Verrucomicrobia bacterium]|nr:tripartite tricarboxylate transporter substrate-binding protein [Verrucomicrobiota bacterium]MDA1066249.1 tripartite tricarboxylate transporter substrate-binding protein [Verrucomicrobiota bacterium]